MKKFVGILLSTFLLASVSFGAFAQTTPHLDRREHRQQKRIRRGVKTGTLTRHEAAKLERQQAKTAAAEAKAKSDGKVTSSERARLNHRMNKTSRHIYQQKHDRQNRH
jgi:tellurite resistance protein